MPRSSQKVQPKQEFSLKNEIIAIVLFAFAVLSFASLFFRDSTGSIGGFIFRVLTTLTGKGAYGLPLFFILCGLIKLGKGLDVNKLSQRVTAFIVIYGELLIILHMLYQPVAWDEAWHGAGGGLAGGLLYLIFIKFFGRLGTVILLISLFLICFILISGGSLAVFARNCLKGMVNLVRRGWQEVLDFIFVEEEDGENEEVEAENVDIREAKTKRQMFDLAEIKNFPGEKEKEIQQKSVAREESEDAKQDTTCQMVADDLHTVQQREQETGGGKKAYQKPPVHLLQKREAKVKENNQKVNQIKLIEDTLANFGVAAKVVSVANGPAITRYELQPAPGVKVSKIVNLSDDLALSLAASDIRIEAPIPGKAAIGIEVPNRHVNMVTFREMVESKNFQNAASRLTIGLGKDVAGETIVADLSAMPHLLVAGATGSGKSVCINTIINSIVYKAAPDEVKMLLIDPKVVELSIYNGIPHLVSPVVTDPKKAASALKWIVKEMENRYKLFASAGARDIGSYNESESQKEVPQLLPQVVVIIDELADLMMVAPNDVEDSICRLAQMARAAGIHLVVATQRPSVDVITGLIKANIPSRISFAVSSQIDSRTILDMSGAEKLIGKGDMLFFPVGAAKPVRVQGAFISNNEVEQVVNFVKKQQKPDYQSPPQLPEEKITEDTESPSDELFADAVRIIIESKQASISLLQRRLRVGYARAARLIDMMEEQGIIGPYEGSKPREVLMSIEDYKKRFVL